MTHLCATLTALFMAGAAPALASSPLDGTWKAETSTAKLSTKPNVFDIKGGTYHCTSCSPPYELAADGQAHAVSGRDYWDAASVTVVNANTIERSNYRKGVKIGTTKITASADGKMLTFTSSSADNAAGKMTTSISMAKRVGPVPVDAHATSGSWLAVNDGAQIAAENLTAKIKVADDTVTMTLGTGESYTAKVNGPKAPFVGDKAGATVALTKAGAGFVETDYVGGKAIGTYEYMPVSASTIKMKAHDLKAGTTDEFTLKKQ